MLKFSVKNKGLLFALLISFLVLSSFVTPQVFSAPATLDASVIREITLVKGEPVIFETGSVTRFAVSDPDILEIQSFNEDEIIVSGIEEGRTTIFIWNESGKRAIQVYVALKDLRALRERVEKLLDAVDIHELTVEISEKEGKALIYGDLPKHKKESYDLAVTPVEDQIIDLVKEEKVDDLIQIDMQITELNESLTKNLGITWAALGGSSGTGGSGGTGGTQARGVGDGGTLSPIFDEGLPGFDGSIGDLLKIGDFKRSSALIAQVNLLVEESKGRILSKPKLVVVSGEEASFLVGGEIPIRTTSSSATGTQENVTFKEFGVGLTVTPEIREEKIDITLNVEISDVDATNKVGANVAFLTRSASTKLYLEDGQPIVLAGLIRTNRTEKISKVPFLGNVPVVGALFRNRSTPVPDKDTELVISLIPTILKHEKKKTATKTEKMMVDVEMDMDMDLELGSDLEMGIKSELVLENEPPKIVSQWPSLRKATLYSMGVPREMTNYVQVVQRHISQSINYPNVAQQNGWEGTVKLNMLILRDGTLAYAIVKESSGFDVFDEYALNTAKDSAPYSQFPTDTDLQELNVTIPIVYSLSN